MLAVEKYTQRLREKIDNMIEISHEIFRHMEPRVPVSSQALRSLETIRYRVAADTETHVLNNTEGSIMPSVEQNMDGPFGGVGDLGLSHVPYLKTCLYGYSTSRWPRLLRVLITLRKALHNLYNP